MSQLPKLLVVDDDPTNFDVVEALLHGESYELHYASDSRRVMERLDRSRYDLILLDVMMPVLDGIALCAQVKAHLDHRWIPIIMLTALNGKHDLARCLEVGADDFISKPVSGLEMRARVRSMLRIRFQQEQIRQMLSWRADMTTAIVHDLRNPLTAILLTGDSLQVMDLPEPVRRKCDRIQVATARLTGLVEDILVLSKLEAGRLTLCVVELEVGELVSVVVNDLDGLASAKQIAIVWDSEERIYLRGDYKLMRRVLENLLSNGIKFAPVRSQVTIRVWQTTDAVQISVIDQGAGIPAHKRSAIWQKYESGDVSRSIVAIGLGLSFVKQVVEAHQGRIDVADNQPRGAIFTISLPKSIS